MWTVFGHFFTPSSFVDRGPFYYIIAWKFRYSIVRQIICKYHFITKNSELWGVHKVNKIFISACPHGLRMTPKLKWNIVVSHRSTKYLTKITVVRPNRVVKCQFFLRRLVSEMPKKRARTIKKLNPWECMRSCVAVMMRRRSNDQLSPSFDMSMAFLRRLGASVWSSQTSSRSGGAGRTVLALFPGAIPSFQWMEIQ